MKRRQFLRAAGGGMLGLGAWRVGVRAQDTGSAVAKRGKASSDAMVAEVEKIMPALMRETAVPGVAIAIVRDGKITWQRGFGVKDTGAKEPVDDATVFEAASISKTAFAYVALKLCEKGVLGLDTPLTQYVPWRFLEGDARLERIAARHVLSHTAGFQDWRAASNPLKIHFAPGTQFSYSGEGYFYLQSVVSHLVGKTGLKPCGSYENDLEVCGTDFDAMMQQRLLAPLGMTASGYLWNDAMMRHLARPHGVDGKRIEKAAPTAADVARYGSAGGLLTTVTDYAKFLIEVIVPKPADEARLAPTLVAEMLRPQAKLAKGEEIDGAGAWALGWAIQERPTGNVVLHSGGQSGFRSLAMASVERKSGFVIFTNSDHGGKVCYDQQLGRALTPLLAG